MMSAEINELQLLEELRQVPRNRWPDVQAYLRSLRSGEQRLMTAADLLQSGLVGLWADRADITDTREFARALRQRAQTRRPDE